jgi:hypothetical protein
MVEAEDGTEASQTGLRRFRVWESAPALLVALAFLLWAVPAIRDTTPDDLRLAYEGGVEAWQTGHPENVETWMSTSLYALAMALVTRMGSLTSAVVALNLLNLLLALATVAVVWWRLRGRVSRVWWWATLALALSFSPLISTLRWKQVNLIVLCLALAGFSWIRRGRNVRGAAAVALSVALKPLAILLPFALFSRRDTRRAALWCFGGIAALTLVGQGFLALRAHDPSVLNPLATLGNYAARARPWGAAPDNFSPQAMVRRITYSKEPFQRTVVTLGIVLAALLANESIKRSKGSSWELLGFTLLFSPMVSPMSWSHYQLLLAPMFVLLAYRFAAERAGWAWWLMLLFAYLLTALVQRPLATTVPGAVIGLLTGQAEEWQDTVRLLSLSQFAQYFLLLTAIGWFNRRA